MSKTVTAMQLPERFMVMCRLLKSLLFIDVFNLCSVCYMFAKLVYFKTNNVGDVYIIKIFSHSVKLVYE